jgi:uroporphyrinogen-III synthase
MAVSSPLHPNLHAYQIGKFTETALHHLLIRVEVLDQKQTALGIFLDIDGAFQLCRVG